MHIKSRNKKTTYLLILIAFVAALLYLTVGQNNWNLKYLFNQKTILLEGELTTEKGEITIYPKAMILNHKGIIIKVDYGLSKELIEKGFSLSASRLPNLELEKNPKNTDSGSTYYSSGVMPKTSHLRYDGNSTYLEYFCSYRQLD
ncbi:hypothetical protein F8154_08765 [Alkaliphilus pronyensis]|uniref:Uncharacterized protein n=1 Tax=Alkaliphilus pronyensis TaxID=1482732 RepID=A0A6I0FB08_9FIRM|nr:hypothetical protein [Alkaliphilus pronyensis]KAB3534492.1 hypothetical protein F8154_08765 [Alkaliphilus pronyensis]